MENNIIKFSQKNISKIKSGMFWYNDDTFSVELLNNKTVKAVVELVDTDLGIVYGDIFIPDKKMKWLEVEKYIKFFNEFSHAQDYRIKDYLFRRMNKSFSLEQVRLFVKLDGKTVAELPVYAGLNIDKTTFWSVFVRFLRTI